MRRVLALVVALLALAAVAAAPALALDRAETAAALAREFRAAGLGSGAYARDLETGRTLFAVREDRPRVPASVQKLFVTAAAFLRLGPDGALQTRVLAEDGAEPDAAGTLEGDLALYGFADPTLGPAGFARLASAVAATGVEDVRGAVVAESSPGALPTGAATTFTRALRQAGVRVRDDPRSAPRPELGTGRELAAVTWLPLATIARAINAPSDNALAERLLRSLGVLGGAATTATGAAVVRDALDDLGVRPRVADGSGLSRANRTTPRQVVRLLERLEAGESGPALRASLAVAGRTGTVRRRMRGTAASGRCAVKTGTLRGVSALAGVCTTTAGGDVAFAWLMNGVYVPGARRIQDRMTAALARYEGE